MLTDEGLELLTEAQCAELLRAASVGRVGVTINCLPVILPVNYTYADGDVLFRTGEGTKLDAATRGAIVAFEVDAYDADAHSGWSVLVIGRSTVVDDPAEQAQATRDVAPWAGGTRTNCVRLHPELVTGRRIVNT